MNNVPKEIDLLRKVASAAEWVIESNRDDPVGKDGRARVGINTVMANGALNKALGNLREHYGIKCQHLSEREEAAGIKLQLASYKRDTD